MHPEWSKGRTDANTGTQHPPAVPCIWLCSGTHMYRVACVFVQGHMPIMWSICISVFPVTLLTALGSYETYIDIVGLYLHMN